METDAYKATTTTETTTTARSEGPGVGLDRTFPPTPLGILLIGAAASALLLSICGSVYPWSVLGGGFAAFAGWAAVIGTGALFFLYVVRLLPKVPGPFGLVILIYLAAIIVLILIAFILSAVNCSSIGGAAIASAIFGAITLGLHGALGFLMFRKWQQLKNVFHRGECGHTYSLTQQTYQASEEPVGPPPAYGNY